MEYRCEATSVVGFIQQLAVAYVGRGYFFYVTGEIPERKDPRAVDRRIIEKYGVSIGKTARSRRKTAGLANIQYLRYRRAFVLLATSGKHSFFEEERTLIRDVREVPIKFGGYAVSYRAGHPHVRIEQRRYLELKAYFGDLATHRSAEKLEAEFRRLPFEPYAPVRGQVFGILREVNRRRQTARFELVSQACLRTRRRILSPFETVEIVVSKSGSNAVNDNKDATKAA
jgi:hypothetical protein